MLQCVCVCVSVYAYNNLKNNGSVNFKPEHFVAYEMAQISLDIGYCPIKIKVTFSPFTIIQNVQSYISALSHDMK